MLFTSYKQRFFSFYFLLLFVLFFDLSCCNKGWNKYLSNNQNTGTTSLSGPSNDLCTVINFNVPNQNAVPIVNPPILSNSNMLYTVTANINNSMIQKMSTTELPQLLWETSVNAQFRTHLLINSNSILWGGSDDCILISVEDVESSATVTALQLLSSCSSSLSGGIIQSEDESIIVTRTIEGLFFGIDSTKTPLTKENILWQSQIPFTENGVIDNFGTLLINPNNGYEAIGIANNILYSLNMNTGNFTKLLLNHNFGNEIIVSSIVADDNGRIYFSTTKNFIYCFLLNTGDLIWSKQYSNPHSPFSHRPSTPALSINFNRVYVVLSFTLCVLDSTDGTLLYTLDLEQEVNMPLYLSVDINDNVYFTSETYLYSIDGNSGSFIYKNNSFGLDYLDSAVIIANNNTIVLQSNSNILFLTDISDSCSTESSDDVEESEDKWYTWIVTTIFCIVIVIFTILFLAELLLKYRKSKYEQISDTVF